MGMAYTVKPNYSTEQLRFDDWEEAAAAVNMILTHTVTVTGTVRVEIIVEEEVPANE